MDNGTRAAVETGGRPDKGRRIAGTAMWVAEKSGLSVGLTRCLFLLAAGLGALLAIAVLIFDTALFGEPLSDPARFSFAVIGLKGVFAYPLLSFILPSKSRSHWDFGSSFGAVMLLVLVGQIVGFMLTPMWRAAKLSSLERPVAGWFTWVGKYSDEVGFSGSDILFFLFCLTSIGFIFSARGAIVRFFRSMYTGVTLISLSLLAIVLGVMVPQIDGFEDPTTTVNLEREYADYQAFQRDGFQKLPVSMQDGHEQYQAFRWAEGYFIYHLLHLYGIGMPKAELSTRMTDGLETFGKKYGTEERDNREKQMRSMFSGRDKVTEIGEFIQRNEASFWRFFQVSTWMQWNRTYKSSWFTALLTLLFCAIALNTFRGKPKQWFSIQKAGYTFVHLGMLTILLGGLTSKLSTQRGIVHLQLAMGPQDTYWGHYDPNKKQRMPFAVSLERFARQDWPSLQVNFNDEEAARLTSRVPTYTLWPGREIELDLQENSDGEMEPRLKIEVQQLADRVTIGRPKTRELPPGEVGGIAMADVVVGEGEMAMQYFLPPVATNYAPPVMDPEFRLAAAQGAEASDWFPKDPDYVGGIDVVVVGKTDGQPHTYAVRLGETVELEGGYRAEVISATADLDIERDPKGSNHPLPLAEQPLRRRAVWLDLTSPEGVHERRAVIEGIHASQLGLQAGFKLSEVEIRFDWDEWGAPGPPRYLLYWNPGEQPELVAQSGEREAFKLNERLPLPGRTPVMPRAIYNSLVFETNVELLPPAAAIAGWDEDFYHQGARGLVLKVTLDAGTPEESSHEVRMSTSDESRSNLWIAPDDSLFVRFFENDSMLPFEWRSVLKVHEPNGAGGWEEVDLGPEPAREIRVNDYFKYKGYRFFQTNANPEDPTYSGIGVVYDPGIVWVVLGMYIVILGTAVAFLVRPVVLARRARAKRALSGSAS